MESLGVDYFLRGSPLGAEVKFYVSEHHSQSCLPRKLAVNLEKFSALDINDPGSSL